VDFLYEERSTLNFGFIDDLVEPTYLYFTLEKGKNVIAKCTNWISDDEIMAETAVTQYIL